MWVRGGGGVRGTGCSIVESFLISRRGVLVLRLVNPATLARESF